MASCPRPRNQITSFDPMSPVPPMTTIFMIVSFLSSPLRFGFTPLSFGRDEGHVMPRQLGSIVLRHKIAPMTSVVVTMALATTEIVLGQLCALMTRIVSPRSVKMTTNLN
jgi:hypothetical protein